MDYRVIIKEAWQFTQSNKKLMKWYAVLPSLITIISGTCIVLYQYFAFKSNSQGHKSFLMQIINFVKDYIDQKIGRAHV